MSHAIPFDTLAFVKELETAGVPTLQAEAQARALSTVLQKVEDARGDELGTKRDLKELEVKMEAIRAELKQEIKELEIRLIKWMVGTSGILFALIKFLPGGH